LFENQNEESFTIACEPKAESTMYLDKLSRLMCPLLENFVVFSSIVSGYGNVGQTNYGLANSVIESICEARKADQLPAVAIQWGAVADVGIVAEMAKDRTLVIGKSCRSNEDVSS
jgi:fatty acid synthase